MAIYKVSKHAVVTLSETLYYELVARKSRIKVSVLCPGHVKTNVMLAERNRPEELKDPDGAVKQTPHDIQFQEALRSAVANGMEPAEVADKVFDALRLERFYILTHPEGYDWIRARMEDILNGNNPRIEDTQG